MTDVDTVTASLGELERRGLLKLFRGQVISKRDIVTTPGSYPIYSSSVAQQGMFGRYGRYMFNEELITWSVDGGGNFFYRPRHKFSVTNVCGYLRVLSDKIDVRFLAYFLQALHLNMHFDYTLKAHPSVIRGAYTIDLPPISVQRSISASLEDVDTFIATSERLIAKKQAIKQGAMQQLLTGKTRLPGFDKPWSEVRLGEVGTFLKGRGVKRDDVLRAGVPCIRYGELYTAFTDYTSRTLSFVERRVAATALPIRTGDLLFAGSGETREEIGKCVAYTGIASAVAGGDIIVLRGTTFNPVYLATLTNSATIAAQKAKRGQGDAVVHISSRALGDIELRLPSKDEQDAISTVLTNSDNEIRLLRYRLAKATAVKQGMMQELLTGRTRLPVEEGAA